MCKLNKNHYRKESRGALRSVIQSSGCDQEGRRLTWETGIEEVGFELFPEGCN